MVPSPRTSFTDPLCIGELPAGVRGGLIGITFCPGKQGDSVVGRPWARDLGLDLDVVERWGARLVLTLVESHELAFLGVPDLGPRVMARGIAWRHLPIVDVQPPGREFDEAWPHAGAEAIARLRAGERVLVHCRGGLGRAGTVAACLLVECDQPPAAAIRAVRAARPGAIETLAQQRFVERYLPCFGPGGGGA